MGRGTEGLGAHNAKSSKKRRPNRLAARVRPNVTLTPAQKRTIYNAVSQQRLRTSPADIPLVVGALVPRSAMLLMLPEHAAGASSAQFLKYAMVDDNVDQHARDRHYSRRRP